MIVTKEQRLSNILSTSCRSSFFLTLRISQINQVSSKTSPTSYLISCYTTSFDLFRGLQTVVHPSVLEGTQRRKARDTLRTGGQHRTWIHTLWPLWSRRLPSCGNLECVFDEYFAWCMMLFSKFQFVLYSARLSSLPMWFGNVVKNNSFFFLLLVNNSMEGFNFV